MHSSFSESVLRIWCLHQTIFLCSKSHTHDKLNLQLTYYRITELNIYQYFILNRKIRGECTIDGKINKPTQWLRWCLQFLWYNIIQFPIIGNLILLYHNILLFITICNYCFPLIDKVKMGGMMKCNRMFPSPQYLKFP